MPGASPGHTQGNAFFLVASQEPEHQLPLHLEQADTGVSWLVDKDIPSLRQLQSCVTVNRANTMWQSVTTISKGCMDSNQLKY